MDTSFINTINSVEELDALSNAIKARKTAIKDIVKEAKADAIATKVAEVNDLINANILKNGVEVVILYGTSNNEIVGTLVGVNTAEKDSLTIESDDFDGKVNDKGKKRRYVKKDRFVRVA